MAAVARYFKLEISGLKLLSARPELERGAGAWSSSQECAALFWENELTEIFQMKSTCQLP
jgi:hypothetical protein